MYYYFDSLHIYSVPSQLNPKNITLYLSNNDFNGILPLNTNLPTLFSPLDFPTKILLFISDQCRAIAA